MVEERIYVQRGPSGVGLFLGLLVAVAIIVAVLWGTGALTVRHDPQNRVEISLDPSQAEIASNRMLDKTGKAIESAGEKIQRQAHKSTDGPPTR